VNGEAVELSCSELFAVNLMGRKGVVSMTELANECARTLSGMTVAVRRLEAKGYVKRARGEGDRRKVYVGLDKNGRRIYQHLLNGEMEVIITMMDSVEPAQQQSFLRALGKAVGSLENKFLARYFDIIRLTPQQQELVADLAGSIYRPCCNNPTSFPDCNHGIALLGLIELMAANGYSREEILTASLQFNAFWFPQHYLKTALVFHLRGNDWNKVDPKEVLGFRYSSASGWREQVDAKLQKEGYLLPGQKGSPSC